ncbi:MAG: aspartate carbamoyltransferase [Candidatus Staskawiczbacteria bacterium]|nr:aspartate carbamoyltransferase [Candidatus Staskawiczbacteria bacterium]
MRTKFDGWPNVIYSQQFSRRWIEQQFLPLTDEMERIFRRGGCDLLKGKGMISFFYEPSTRTRASHEVAMRRLGGDVIFSTENAREFSSAKKGETFEHTIKVLCRYGPNVIVIRYDHEIGAEFAAKVSNVPIINAGDRAPGQHPTQELLDLRTIFKHRGEIDGLNIAMVGDLLNGRTVRSLSYLLGKYKKVTIYYVSPGPLMMKDDVKEYLRRHGVLVKELTDLREVASKVDVIYQTRTQGECGAVFDRRNQELGYFMVNREILDLMRKDAIIMHPLPCVDEITREVDDDPRAVYLTLQIDSGTFARMALLKMILAPKA